MAWVGDFVFSVGAAMAMRFTVSIPERQETVLRDLGEAAAALYFASARSWDNLLTRLQVGVAESTPFKKWLFDRFMRLAIDGERRRLAGEKPGAWRRLQRALGEALVYGPTKDQLGLSRARRSYTAGEAIGGDTFPFFAPLGLDLTQFSPETRMQSSSHTLDGRVLAAGRDHLAAIVCFDAAAVGLGAETHGVAYPSYADLSQKPEVCTLVAGVIRHVTELLPPPLRLKRFVNLHKEFDPDDGEVTRTRKLRRNVIEERYAAVIAALYGDAAAVEFDARVTYETGASGLLRRRLVVMEVGA